jgi:hypothetical protein
MLREAGVRSATYLVTLCGDDGVNAEVAVDACKLVQNYRKNPLKCVVQIVDPQLLSLLRGREMALGNGDYFRLEFFNVFERGARAVLNDYPPFPDDPKEVPHILVVGIGRMGESVVAHAARSWRHIHRNDGERIRITIVDREANTKREHLHLHFPLLEKVCDLKAIEMDVRSPQFHRSEFLFDSEGQIDVTYIYVCLDNDSRAMAAALILHETVREFGVPMVVRMTHEEGLAGLIRGVQEDTGDREGKLTAFGLLDRTCTRDLILGGTREILARDIHEEYVAREIPVSRIVRNDEASVPWEALPKSLREMFRGQADHLAEMLRSIGCTVEPLTNWDADLFRFTVQETELLAKLDYDRYREEKVFGRWIYMPGYESIKDLDDLSPMAWQDCPEEIREAFRRPIRDLPIFLAKEDFQIRRLKNPVNREKSQ